MRLKREHQIIRLENAIAKGMVTDDHVLNALELTLGLYHSASENNARQSVYWTAIRHIVKMHDYGVDAYMKGRIPHTVKLKIHEIARVAREEVYEAYLNIHDKLGFLPIKVDSEELHRADSIAHSASMKVMRSIERRLTNAYKAGGWDGSVESAPNHFGQRSLDAPNFNGGFE